MPPRPPGRRPCPSATRASRWAGSRSALGGAALVVLALWQLGSLPFCARRRAAWCGRAAQGVGLVLSTLLMVAGAPGPLNTPVNVTAALGFETAQACPLPLQTGPRIRDP